MARAGAPVEGLAPSVDFAQTLLSRLGLAQPYGMQGTDLGPMITGAAEDLCDHVFLEDDRERVYLGLSEPQHLRSIVTRSHRLTVYNPMHWSELFDLDNDPHEVNNLWRDPAASDLRHRMTERLLHACIENDTRLPFSTGMA